ncbi:MAG: Hsp70 family protein, partial [Candidatus Thermoplasmatota archaeon]|nr:Hsp70 family protein [Candidatus Thermoplasmatota archaeon]
MRNTADSVVYQTRKMIEEAGDKLSEDDTKPVLEKLDELEALIVKDDQPIALEDLDEATIQAKMSELEQAMHAVSTKLYEAAAAEMAEQQDSDDGEEVVDADFEVVDSDEEDES